MSASSIQAAAATLLSRLDETRTGALQRFEAPVDSINLLDWLAAQHHPVKGYWQSRDGREELAALGECDEIKSDTDFDYDHLFQAARDRLLQAAPGLRYYGGFRFSRWRMPETPWRPFGTYRFILPQVELVRRGEARFLACNLAGPLSADPVRTCLLHLVDPAQASRSRLPELGGRRDEPDQAGWVQAVERLLAAIRAGEVRKAVLARQSALEFAGPLDSAALLTSLCRHTSGCFHFYGSKGPFAFLGASPERLFRREGGKLWTEALAGTRPRGACREEDSQLEYELASSAKDRAEHAIVADTIREALTPVSEAVRVDAQPQVIKLEKVQHLCTGISAELRPGVTDAELLRRLHPTPAGGGSPRQAAMGWVDRLENFDRGWYTGPAGWIGADGCEFAVAIRCGLVFNNRLFLYAGAGIVEGSNPGSEWAEIENKIGNFIGILKP